jgi:oxygen-independent coproporphyrinogen-3 oxidase
MIYVHVPFCRSFCTYCGFYSELCSRKETQQVQNRLFGDYAEALCEEIASRQEEISAARSENAPDVPAAPDTLYIGGGTPSVLPLPVLERIVKALGPATYEEFTVEVNPDDVVAGGPEYVDGLRALGVNRVSMGVQSFDDGILRWMNRRHDAAGAREAFRLLRACDFDNISIDLIFGVSQLSEAWSCTVREALALRPEHISAYQLSIEEDSALERMVSDGRYAEASDEQCRSQYDTLCRMLADAGYVHYEISNWARPGREAVHNSAYWRRVPYVGLGPGAHSFAPGSHRLTPDPRSLHTLSSDAPAFASEVCTRPTVPRAASSFPAINSSGLQSLPSDAPAVTPGIRSWNSRELPRREAGGRLVRWRAEQEVLSAAEAAEETIMLGLRTASGLPLATLRTLSPSAPIDTLISEGALQLIPSPASSVAPTSPSVSATYPTEDTLFVRIPEDHFFVSDDIIAQLLP